MTERELNVKKLKKAQSLLLRLNIELASVKLRGEQHHVAAIRDSINQAIDRIETAIRPTVVG